MTQVHVQYKGTVRDLLEMGKNAQSFEPIADKLIDALIEGEQDLWSRSPWKRDKPATVASKIARGLDPRTMRATGGLEAKLTTRGAPDQIASASRTRLIFGAKDKGGNIAQYNKRNKRVVVRAGKQTRERIREIVMDNILKDLKHHG